jgi:SAM-dependent methyltransferase
MRAVGDDPYADGVYRWWHLSAPSPELLAAEADGWLGEGGAAIDIGCGAGTEIAHLAGRGWKAVGVDLSRRRSTLRDASIPTCPLSRRTRCRSLSRLAHSTLR